MNFETMSNQRKMILIAAAVGVIATFLPWFSISVPMLGSHSVSGMNDWGILCLLCFLAAGALAFLGNQTTNLDQKNWMLVLIAGGIAVLITIIKLLNPPLGLGRSFGLFIATAAAIGVVAFAYMHRSAGDSFQSGFDSLKSGFNQQTQGTATSTPNDPPRPTP
jgi:peptidoglycan/LPS O-acetylase OafA/YrhL